MGREDRWERGREKRQGKSKEFSLTLSIYGSIQIQLDTVSTCDGVGDVAVVDVGNNEAERREWDRLVRHNLDRSGTHPSARNRFNGMRDVYTTEKVKKTVILFDRKENGGKSDTRVSLCARIAIAYPRIFLELPLRTTSHRQSTKAKISVFYFIVYSFDLFPSRGDLPKEACWPRCCQRKFGVFG